ncbi:MAG: leucyl aminopeptidase [Saprospirales bacterium]|nr:leucyl aminopeptidase [Saprospirales bacterium]
MKVEIRQQFGTSTGVVLIPVAKQGDFKDIITLVASKTGLSDSLINEEFKGDLKETASFFFKDGSQTHRLILLGLGENPGFKEMLQSFRSLVFRNKEKFPKGITLDLEHSNTGAPYQLLEAAVNGMVLGPYDTGKFKTEQNGNKVPEWEDFTLELIIAGTSGGEENELKQAVRKGQIIAEAQWQMMDLVNAPANKKPPQHLAAWAIESGRKHGYDVKVYELKELQEMGMEALIAVNRGSEHPPVLIVMEYKPAGTPVKKVGLVGKGVTFDTGGLSLKPSGNMHYMKSDMGGAAAVMGAMEAASRLQLPVHLIGVVPSTENSVDANSTKPGDVIGSYSGKTIEVIDTDAEGRLILADALNYVAKNYQPDFLLDLATLTGSCIRTLGTHAGGLFSNNEALAKTLYEIGMETGERLWQLPIWEDYQKEMNSDVADIKNLSSSPAAGAITAAKFLEFFIEKHPAWAHMDIAGVAFGDSEFSKQKSATGFGVRLLVEFLEKA